MVNEKNDHENVPDKEKIPPFTAKTLREPLDLGRTLVNYILQHDPDAKRALQFQRDIDQCLAPYEKMHKELCHKQSKITDFITKTPRAENTSAIVEMVIEPDLNLIVSSEDESDQI